MGPRRHPRACATVDGRFCCLQRWPATLERLTSRAQTRDHSSLSSSCTRCRIAARSQGGVEAHARQSAARKGSCGARGLRMARAMRGGAITLLRGFLHLARQEELVQDHVDLVEVEDQVQLAHIAEELVEQLDEEVDRLEVEQLVVIHIDAKGEEQPGITAVDELVVGVLRKRERERERPRAPRRRGGESAIKGRACGECGAKGSSSQRAESGTVRRPCTRAGRRSAPPQSW